MFFRHDETLSQTSLARAFLLDACSECNLLLFVTEDNDDAEAFANNHRHHRPTGYVMLTISGEQAGRVRKLAVAPRYRRRYRRRKLENRYPGTLRAYLSPHAAATQKCIPVGIVARTC